MLGTSIPRIGTRSDVEAKTLALKALREKKKRAIIIENMKADSFKEQWDFIADNSRRKAALTPRRGGKSMADATLLVKTAINYPGCNMLYTGLTDKSAIRIIWKDCLKKLAHKHKITLKFVESKNIIRFEDLGAVIYLLGLDTKDSDMDKIYGVKLKLALIDEAALYKQDIQALVRDILEPACVDDDGTICLTGMPCNNTKSFFFEVTSGQHPGWALHRWSAFDNPYVAKQMRRHIDNLKTLNPGIENTPNFRQQYMGEWVVDQSARIYKFTEEKNTFETLPDAKTWHFVLGVDLGYDDASAFTVVAYRDYDSTLYVMSSYKRSGMIITDVANLIKQYESIYKIEKTIVDGSDKQSIEELKQRHGLNLTPAERSSKADFIRIMNDDFLNSRIKLKKKLCEQLEVEYNTLVWDEKALTRGEFKETKRAKNHCADSALYAWRHCYNWVDRGVEYRAPSNYDEEIEEFWRKEEERINSNKQYFGIEDQYGYNY